MRTTLKGMLVIFAITFCGELAAQPLKGSQLDPDDNALWILGLRARLTY